MLRRLAVAAVATLAVSGLAACGSDSSDSPDSAGSAGKGSGTATSSATPSTGSVQLADSIEGLTVTGAFGKEPKVAVDGLDVKDVEATLVREGDGAVLQPDGAAMTSIYLAKGADGSKLQSSYATAPFKMVVADINKEIASAVTGQHIGSRIAVAAPATTLYGPQGTQQLGLKTDDDVVLVIDLVKPAKAPAPALKAPEGKAVAPPADAPKPVEKGGDITGIDFSGAPKSPPKKLQVIPLIDGTGPKVAAGSTITADYYGAVWGAKDKFDDSYSRGEPLKLPLSNLVKGWGQGLEGVKVGSRVMLVIPPELGYGDQAQGDIPAGSTLVFVVDVLGVS